MIQIDFNDFELNWLGHAGFVIYDKRSGYRTYIDPFQIPNNAKLADFILITHSHYDHLSIEDIKKISKPETIIIAPVDCQSKFQGKIEARDIKIITPGQVIDFYKEGLNVTAIKSYNTDKQFHPVGNDWVGYILKIQDKIIYHAGDADIIPEMTNLRDIDVALVPVSGKFVMDPQEAATAVNQFRPKLAIPMHYGSIVGTQDDAIKFKELAQVPVEILEKQS